VQGGSGHTRIRRAVCREGLVIHAYAVLCAGRVWSYTHTPSCVQGGSGHTRIRRVVVVCREGLIEARIRVLVSLLERTPGVLAAYPFPKGYFAQAPKAPGSQASAAETTYQTSFFVSVVFPPRQGMLCGLHCMSIAWMRALCAVMVVI
jgi:hypothetical protein